MKTSFKSTALILAALGSVMTCYSVSLKASTERAGVEAARQRIAHDVADIRLLQAELRTRARLPELQRWNEQVLALAPPRAEQFVDNPVMLASYTMTPSHAPVQVAVVRDAPPAAAGPLQRVVFTPHIRAARDLGADAALIGAVASADTIGGFQKIALR